MSENRHHPNLAVRLRLNVFRRVKGIRDHRRHQCHHHNRIQIVVPREPATCGMARCIEMMRRLDLIIPAVLPAVAPQWRDRVEERVVHSRINKTQPKHRLQIKKKWVGLFPILLFLGLWEICYYTGLIDPNRFSHPKAVIQTLLNNAFLEGFGLMAVQLTFASLVGGGIGVAIGSVMIRSDRLAQAAIRFLRIGMWLPFLISWAIPISSSAWRNWFVPITVAWIESVNAVVFAACYHYLNGRFILGLEWGEAKQEVIRGSILQALFICLISQVWVGPYGWMFFWPGTQFIERIYAAAILLFIILGLVNDECRYSFDQTSKARGDTIRAMLTGGSWRLILDIWLIVLAVAGLWQILSLSGFDPFISSPLAILKGGYYLVFTYPYGQSVFWSDIPISLGEILGGLILGGGAALIVSKAASVSPTIKSYVHRFLPLTFVLPVLLPLLLDRWVGHVDFWWTLVGIASVCFFPYMEVFSGLRDSPLLCRVLFAADNALPFAFVAMTFGEAISSSAGLGFLMVVGRATLLFPNGLGAALITVALFVILSATLRFAAKRVHFAIAA